MDGSEIAKPATPFTGFSGPQWCIYINGKKFAWSEVHSSNKFVEATDDILWAFE
jgi:hypothetical protein